MSAAASVHGGAAMALALGLFLAAYVVIITDKINRSIVALLGAGVMIIAGVLTQAEAFAGIDFNTLGLLTGMMVIVAITQKSGVFQYAAIVTAKLVKASPWGLLLMLSLVTALFSSVLDNVTAVLLITSVALVIIDALDLSPYPYLYAIIFASNIGGTATLIGDPPNIMIGSAVGLTFNDFLLHMAPISAVVALASVLPIYLIWGRKLTASPEARAQVMAFQEKDAIKDVRLLKQSMSVVVLVLAGFIFGHPRGLEPATVAMFGAAVLLLLRAWGKHAGEQSDETHKTFAEVEWVTIFFFIGLFVMVAGVEKSGALELLSQLILRLTEGDFARTAYVVLWGSAIFSAVFDNIPFVATMIPVIKNMGAQFGEHMLQPLWWSLALGACLGGNGTLIGASANLVVAGFSERAGYPIRFVAFTLFAFPLMLFSIAICHVYLYLRYLA